LHNFWLTAYLEAGKKVLTKKQRAKQKAVILLKLGF